MKYYQKFDDYTDQIDERLPKILTLSCSTFAVVVVEQKSFSLIKYKCLVAPLLPIPHI